MTALTYSVLALSTAGLLLMVLSQVPLHRIRRRLGLSQPACGDVDMLPGAEPCERPAGHQGPHMGFDQTGRFRKWWDDEAGSKNE